MAFTHTQALSLLRQAQRNQRLPHALLLTGTEAAGTHELALNIAQELNGGYAESLDSLRHPMCRVIRPASKSRSILINNIREIEPFLALRADEGAHKIIIMVEAHRMKEEAANAFLKTLEEPPPATLIILITEQPDHLLPTILSRCIRMDLRATNQELVLTDVQQQFLPMLQVALTQLGSNVAALALRADFQQILTARRDAITKRITLAVKEESKAISEGTGIGDWEARQKDSTAAHIETEYLSQREEMLELLSICLGQAVLIASHAPDAKALVPEIATMAEQQAVPQLIQRMRSVDALRRDLQYNINEALALDVRMMEIIGQASN